MKLEVGMWARSKHGRIFQINKINEVRYTRNPRTIENFDELYKDKSRLVINGRYELKDIVKISNSILGDADNPCLIEAGDYVNGKEVAYVDEFGKYIAICEVDITSKDFEGRYEFRKIKKEDIKTILSKEMFEKMSYKVDN